MKNKIKLFEITYNNGDEIDYITAKEANFAITGAFKDDLCDSLDDIKEVREVPESECAEMIVSDPDDVDFESFCMLDELNEINQNEVEYADDYYFLYCSKNRW